MFYDNDRNEVGWSQLTDAETHDREVTEDEIRTPYLGPATIVTNSQERGWVEVRMHGGASTKAQLAIAVPYQLTIGNEVLVISQNDSQVYVIGVLQQSSQTTWRVPNDLVIEAPCGGIRFTSAGPMRFKSKQKMDIASPRVILRAARLEFSARRLIQRIENAYLSVKELFQVKSRRVRTVADESFLIKTKRARMKSEGNFNINGKTIHLG